MMFGYKFRKFTVLILIFATAGIYSTNSSAENEVGITKSFSYLDVMHDDKIVRIERIQDTSYKLNNSFTKTSRPCPPFCIQPIQLHPDIKTMGEVELLIFLDTEVKKK